MKPVPSMPNFSAAANAAGTTAAPGCDCEGPCESSVSSEWASTPLASAASKGPVSTTEPATVPVGVTPHGTGECDRGLAGRQLGSRDHGGERIQDVLLGLLDDVRGERPLGGGRHVIAERGHDRPRRFRAQARPWQRRRPGCDGATGHEGEKLFPAQLHGLFLPALGDPAPCPLKRAHIPAHGVVPHTLERVELHDPAQGG